MPGPDPYTDIIQTENFLDENFEFTGTEGIPYQEFLKRVRGAAFRQGRSRDSEWMADMASLHISGDALKWYESLDDDVRQDWSLLRKAIIGKYGDGSTEATYEAPLSPAKPTPSVEENTAKQSDNPGNHLLPARVEIVNWATPALVSNIRFPKSESEWLDEARQRKSKFGDRSGVVYWRLVETWEPIPGNAIETGNEGGTRIFSIRVWKDGNLTIGKQVRGSLFWSGTRAWIPWWGREVSWSGPFEILVGDQSAVRWVSPREAGRFHAVEGGFEGGSPNALLIAQFYHMGMSVPGKAFSSDDIGHFGWWQVEFHYRDFCVLAWT